MPTEAPVEATENPLGKQKKQWWRGRSFLLVSVAVHLLFVLLAVFWVVSHYTAGRKLTFNAGPKSPNPSERALQHQVQLAQKTQRSSAPATVPKRVISTGAAKVELPPMPSMPAIEQSTPMPKMAAAGGAGFGGPSGNSSVLGGTGTGAQINFFGIRDKSNSVVIMIDVSDSMFTRTGDAAFGKGLLRHGKEQSFQTVRDEAIQLIEKLGPNVNFGIVRWSGGAYSWKEELVPATE